MKKLIGSMIRKLPKDFQSKQRGRIMYLYTRIDLKGAVEYSMGNAKMDWENPKNLNQKLMWLNMGPYYHNDTITRCCDKVRIKDYIKEKGVDIKCAETLGVYRRAKEIDWDALPDDFVLKCNHGCGYNIVVKGKEALDRDETAKKLDKWMRRDYWRIWAEPQYRFIDKRIMAEEYLGDDLVCYKFYCFNGEPKVFYVSHSDVDDMTIAGKDRYLDYYDIDKNPLDITLKGHLHKPLPFPDNFDRLVEVSKELSKDFPFVRVDLYPRGDDIYLSELTFVPTGGRMNLGDPAILDEWGEWLTLPEA